MSHFTVGVFTKTDTEEEVRRLLFPYKEHDGDMPREYLEFEEDEDADIDAETGKRGWWYNPKTKWDWYSIGGRWSGLLRLKYKSGEYDFAKVSHIDFDYMREEAMKRLDPYDKCLEREFRPNWFIEKYPTEEIYKKIKTTFYTYAVVTPDGEWKAVGEMGWFGWSSETADARNEYVDAYAEKFIKPAIENGWYLTIVDCHI